MTWSMGRFVVSIGWLVGRSVCHTFLKGWGFTLLCAYRITCLSLLSNLVYVNRNIQVSSSLVALVGDKKPSPTTNKLVPNLFSSCKIIYTLLVLSNSTMNSHMRLSVGAGRLVCHNFLKRPRKFHFHAPIRRSTCSVLV